MRNSEAGVRRPWPSLFSVSRGSGLGCRYLQRSEAYMRMLPIVVALGLLVTTPILAVGQSAKMDGREQMRFVPLYDRKFKIAVERCGRNRLPASKRFVTLSK